MRVDAHEDFLLTVAEAARELRVGEGTVRRLVKRGALPAVRWTESGPLRIPADDLQELVRSVYLGGSEDAV